MRRSQSLARGGPTHPISGTLSGSEQRRALAEKSLQTRRAFTLKTFCRGAERARTRGAPWLADVMGAGFAL